MKIRLNEIPEEGRKYHFNRESNDLNPILSDLIRENPYEIDISIRPLNSRDFVLTGQLRTQTPEQCSRCGEDFNLHIDKKLNEILIPSHETDRISKSTKSGSVSENSDEVAVTEYKNHNFDLGEYLHEAVALEVPFTPYCVECSKTDASKRFNYDENMGDEIKANPFKALKGIKLN
jgi:uncharacterized protein